MFSCYRMCSLAIEYVEEQKQFLVTQVHACVCMYEFVFVCVGGCVCVFACVREEGSVMCVGVWVCGRV